MGFGALKSAQGGSATATGGTRGDSSIRMSKSFGNTGGNNLSTSWIVVAVVAVVVVVFLWKKK